MRFAFTRSGQDRLTSWSPVVMLGLLAALTYWLNVQVRAPVVTDFTKRHDMDYFLDNFVATHLGEDGKPREILTALKLVHFPDDNTTHIDRPNFVQLSDQNPPLRITAQQALVSENGTDVYFYGQVNAVQEALASDPSRGPVRLETDYLHVVPDKDWAETDRAVTITQPRAIIHAIGLEMNNKTRTTKLVSKVRGQFIRQQ